MGHTTIEASSRTLKGCDLLNEVESEMEMLALQISLSNLQGIGLSMDGCCRWTASLFGTTMSNLRYHIHNLGIGKLEKEYTYK